MILSQGERCVVYLCDADVPFFRTSLSPISSRAWYQEKVIFLEPVVKDMSKEEILLNLVIIQSNFCVLEYAFDRLFQESGITWGQKFCGGKNFVAG